MPGRVSSSRIRNLAMTCFGVPPMIISSSICFSSDGRPRGFCARPEALPPAYMRYLTNSLREAFDLPGVPIRFKLRKGENPFAPERR